MKYGLMYYKDTDNIGDDIQTYVAKRFLPHIDYYVDREALNCFIPKEKEYVSMIMNGWYLHNKCAWPPSPYINPLLISMHFMSVTATDVGDNYIKGLGGDYLKKYAPIGARDIETKKRLENNGIESFFSGCMTLTLNKFDNVVENNKILLVDAEEAIVKKVKEENTEFDIEEITHWVKPEEISKKTIDERLNDVEELLKKYQGAHVVITNRLHVALPCIALGTPVILVHKKYFDEDRLGTFLKYMDNYVDSDFLNLDVKELLKNPKPNNDEYLEIRNSLISRCEEFVQKCETTELDSSQLPEIDSYYENYVKKIGWYKDIFEIERKALESTETKRVTEYEKLHSEIENLNTQNNALYTERNELYKELKEQQDKIDALNAELNNIYNSKGWKSLEKMRKILRKK